MQHISTTPFGRRAVTRAHLAARGLARSPVPNAPPDKWTLLRDLTAGRAAFGVSDRDLAVLSALLSFHPEPRIEEGEVTVVWPSNAALCARAHGMAESTLRRHIAALVGAGLLLRHDSPNGKRFAARDGQGGLAVAFGFDLRPLLVRAGEITAAAQAAREAALRLKRLREVAVLALRDAGKLIAFAVSEGLGGGWTALEARQRALGTTLRRKLDIAATEAAGLTAKALLAEVAARLESVIPPLTESDKMSGKAGHFERHIQDSNQKYEELEPAKNRGRAAGGSAEGRAVAADAAAAAQRRGAEGAEGATKDGHEEAGAEAQVRAEVKLPLYLVVKSCPELAPYAPEGIRNWRDLSAAVETVRPFLGISTSAWAEARLVMGEAVAAITLACILQRSEAIRSPGGYLRSLTARAQAGAFSPGPMVMALLNGENRRPA